MNFNHEELMLMMLYNTGTRMGLVHELRLMQCYLMPDETALRELSEGVIEKLKLLTDAEFAELEFPPDCFLPPARGVHQVFCSSKRYAIIKSDKLPFFKRFLRNFPVALLVSKIRNRLLIVRT